MQRLSARPHHVGSPYDKDNAEWILAKFKEFGLDAHIESFRRAFPHAQGTRRRTRRWRPKFTAKLQEPRVAGGSHFEPAVRAACPPTTRIPIDGDVTAPLVYVNYGVPADYEQLERLGVSVKGAIVIARYGHSWRGIKPKVAAEHGAIGCLIYSDPHDDGYFQGDVSPKAPTARKTACSAAASWTCPLYPGDPLTPGVGATKDAKRLRSEGRSDASRRFPSCRFLTATRSRCSPR